MTELIEVAEGRQAGRWTQEISGRTWPGEPRAAQEGDEEDEDLDGEDLDDEEEDEDDEFLDDEEDIDDEDDEEDDDPVRTANSTAGLRAPWRPARHAPRPAVARTDTHEQEGDQWPNRPRSACGSRLPRHALTRADS